MPTHVIHGNQVVPVVGEIVMITLYDTLMWNARVARDRAARRRDLLIAAAWLLAALAILAFMLLTTAGLCSDNPRADEDRPAPAAGQPTPLVSPVSESASEAVGGRDRPLAGGAATAGFTSEIPESTPLAIAPGPISTSSVGNGCQLKERTGKDGNILSGVQNGHLDKRPGRVLDAIRQVESSGNPTPPDGDGGDAIGPYQIHHEYWLDARMPSGTYQDCRREDYARRVVTAYLARYAPGGSPERLARCHNGGPVGYLKPQTAGYWRKVSKELKTGGF
jgi:hypothetical protein